MGAQWMAAGFVHGVLNTDNINVTGESFDYGPWRFLPVYDPAFTAAYFDHNGLYAFGRQPDALLWNLYRLAECLLPLATQADLEKALEVFEPALHHEFSDGLLRRLGLASAGPAKDAGLARTFWTFLSVSKAPFEQVFFDWHGGLASARRAQGGPSLSFYAHPAFEPVLAALDDFSPRDGVRLDHPYFARPVPCTMLIEEVEDIWKPIAEADDWSAFDGKLADIRTMGQAYGNGIDSA
jgi:uncharacterized protein YdiU (UPF0061 family)